MGCDYYVRKTLCVSYFDEDSQLCEYAFDLGTEKGYVYDRGNDDESFTWRDELAARIRENTMVKVLYQDKQWIKERYQRYCEPYLTTMEEDVSIFISEIVSIRKEYEAWERE